MESNFVNDSKGYKNQVDITSIDKNIKVEQKHGASEKTVDQQETS